MRLAFGVHDLENFKFVLLRFLDANVASSASASLIYALHLDYQA